MKNLFKNLMLVAVAAMAFVACSQDVNDINILPKQTTLNFTARFVDDTRAYFGEKSEEGYPVYWAGGEAVAFVAPAADYEGTYTTYAEAVKADEQGIEATFDVVFDNPIKAGTVYAYLGDGWNPMSNYAYVNNYQTPTATSVDPNCIMASTSFEYDGETMEVSGDFAHGAGYGKMTINGFEGKTISSVELSFAGTNYCNYTLNVADIAEHTYWFASEENEVSNFTISVVVDGVSYSKEVEIGSDKHLYFKKGLVSKFSVSGLVKDPIQLETPIVTTSFADGKVTASWSPIENAESYTVKVNDTVVEENYKEISYSFDASYSTYYSISVIANAAEGSADYVDSDEAFTSITTPLDINMVTDYTVTLTNYTIDLESSYGDKLFKFTSNDATKWINLPVNPNLNDVLPAGTYTGVYDYWSYSSDANLEFNYYDTQFNYSSLFVNEWATSKSGVEVVRESDDTWSITIVVLTEDNYSIKYVYSEEPEDPNVFADHILDKVRVKSDHIEFYREYVGDGTQHTTNTTESLRIYLHANNRGNDYISTGEYTCVGTGARVPTSAGTVNMRYTPDSYWYNHSTANTNSTLSVSFVNNEYVIIATINGETWGYKGLPEGWVAPGGGEGGEEPEQPELTALATPELIVTVSGNTVNASWNPVTGAANYTVTCGNESKTVEGTTVTFEGLEYGKEYTVTVVANPADPTANTASEAASKSVTTEANAGGDEPGGDEPATDFIDWHFSAHYNTSNRVITLTGKDDSRVITVTTNDLAFAKFYADTTRSSYFTDATVDGVATSDVTAESYVHVQYNQVSINLVINGVTYTGNSDGFTY